MPAPLSLSVCPSSPGSYFANHFIMGGEKFDSTHPEGYLFGENSDLNFLGNRPVLVGTGGGDLVSTSRALRGGLSGFSAVCYRGWPLATPCRGPVRVPSWAAGAVLLVSGFSKPGVIFMNRIFTQQRGLGPVCFLCVCQLGVPGCLNSPGTLPVCPLLGLGFCSCCI